MSWNSILVLNHLTHLIHFTTVKINAMFAHYVECNVIMTMETIRYRLDEKMQRCRVLSLRNSCVLKVIIKCTNTSKNMGEGIISCLCHLPLSLSLTDVAGSSPKLTRSEINRESLMNFVVWVKACRDVQFCSYKATFKLNIHINFKCLTVSLLFHLLWFYTFTLSSLIWKCLPANHLL